jgi:hypothetical protein
MQFIEGGTPPQDPGAFRPTFTDDVWAVTSADRRAIGLYRTAHLQALLNEALAELAPQGIRFIAYAHEAGGDREAIAAGPVLPGWQMSFIVVDNAVLETDARPRLLTYLWVGFAGITTVALIGIVAGQTLGRRLRLAQMKTDLTAAAPSGPVREQPHRVLAETRRPRVTAARAAGRPRSPRARQWTAEDRSRRWPGESERRARSSARRPQCHHGRTRKVRRRAGPTMHVLAPAQDDLEDGRERLRRHVHRDERRRPVRFRRRPGCARQLVAPIPEGPRRDPMPSRESRLGFAALAPLRHQACHPRRTRLPHHPNSSDAEDRDSQAALETAFVERLQFA